VTCRAERFSRPSCGTLRDRIDIEGVRVSGTYIKGISNEPNARGKKALITTRAPADTAAELAKYNVKFAGTIESTFMSDLLSSIVPVLLFFGPGRVVVRALRSRVASAAPLVPSSGWARYEDDVDVLRTTPSRSTQSLKRMITGG
jgi:hypothetical protein